MDESNFVITSSTGAAPLAGVASDGPHKITTALAREYGTVVVEDLNVTGMLRNRRLARHIADASFGESRCQLAYKTTWSGGRLVVADRFPVEGRAAGGAGVGAFSDHETHLDRHLSSIR